MTKRKDAPPPPKTKNGRNANLVRSNAFRKGQPKPPGTGRRKGQRNRVTVALKDAILEAATLVGHDGRGKDGLTGYLMMLAVKEKAVYARLLEKVLPLQLHVEDKTDRPMTAVEAVERLKERGLPIPPTLNSLARSTGYAGASAIAGALTHIEENYEAELDGIDGNEDEADE